MTSIDEIRSDAVGFLDSTSLGRRAGPFVFLGSQMPFDLERARLVKSLRDVPDDVRQSFRTGIILNDAPDDRILAQTWQLFRNVQEILAGIGATFDHVVHQRLFLREMRDLPAIERVLRALMPNGLPSTAAIGATSAGVDPTVQIQADFIVIDPRSGLTRQNVSIPELDPLCAPYPLASRAGQYVFTTPLAGVDPESGRLVERLSQLSEEERAFAEPPYSVDQEAAVAQHMMIFRHIRRILESQGGSLQGQARMNGWLRIPFQEFGPLARVRKRMFSAPGMQVPATSFPMSGVRTKNALFEWQTIALLPPRTDSDPRKSITMPQHPLAPYQVPALFAGPFLFTAGEVAIDTRVPHVVGGFADLEGEARQFSYGRIHAENPIMAQTLFVYEKLKSYLEAYGLSMDRTLHQTVYIMNPAEYPIVERMATLFFGSKLPPTTIVPIQGVSPFREALLEIEITAA
jgi:enamine deaminase RidA (YjgF/YER057c/UK114 family)